MADKGCLIGKINYANQSAGADMSHYQYLLFILSELQIDGIACKGILCMLPLQNRTSKNPDSSLTGTPDGIEYSI